MKLSLHALLYAAALLLAGVRTGQAEEIRLSPDLDPFAQPVSNTTFSLPDIKLVGQGCGEANCGDAGPNGCADDSNSCQPQRHVGGDFFVCKDRCGGWVGSVDFLLFKPFASESALASGTAQMNYNPAYRLTFGRQNAEGLGARMRYFSFDQVATGNPGDVIGVDVRYLDLEATQTVDFRRWNLLFSGGLRYVETNYEVGSNLGGFDGIGLTFAGQATRDLNRSGSLRLTSGARWSSAYGNTKVNGDENQYVDTDDLTNIMELNIGPQYRRQLRNGGYLTLGVGLETQYWSNAPVGYADTQDFGFAGFATSVAITR